MEMPRRAAPPPRMDAEAFVAWAMDQPAGRYELVDGEVVAMAPERVVHNRIKARAWRALDDAVRAAGLPCQAFTDGMAVRVDDGLVFEPDASLRCGPPLDDDAVVFDDPLVVVEVLSPGTRGVDAGKKLGGYFLLPSVRHYVMLDPGPRTAIHHARAEDGAIATAILRDGALRLDPPGIAIPLAALFEG